MQTECIICLVTQISKKVCINQIKAHSAQCLLMSCFSNLQKSPTVTEKYTAFKLLLSSQQLVHMREKEEGEYF